MHDTLYWLAVILTAIAATLLMTLAYLDLPTKRERERGQR